MGPSKGSTPYQNAKAAAERAKAQGLAPKEMLKNVEPGAVFTIPDEHVDFPESRLPSAGPRNMHGTRRVIIVQCIKWSRAADPKTIFVVPCSSSGGAGPMDVSLPKGEDGFDAEHVVAYASLMQPILKSDLIAYKGTISAETLVQIRSKLAQLLELQPSSAITLPPPISHRQLTGEHNGVDDIEGSPGT